MQTSFDVLVAGEINPDLILSGDVEPVFGQVEKLVTSEELTIGSSSAIFACGVARLGLHVAFIGKCGDDVFGRYMLNEMAKRGVDVGHVLVDQSGSTGVSVILNRGTDRAILTYLGLIPSMQVKDIPESLLVQSRHLHVASYFLQEALQPDLADLFEHAHSLGLTTSLDTNYDPSEEWQGFDRLLKATNIFLPNEKEACSLAGTNSVESALDMISKKVETLAIKLGARGAMGVSKGKRAFADSLPIQVVDTVGAGDSFDAGFIFGYLQDWSFERTLKTAAICGALSTRAAGGTAAQATLPEILSLLETA